MKPSVIAYESDLTSRIRQYLDGYVSFDELVRWVDEHELSWAEFEFGSRAEKLAILVMSLFWERQNGDYTDGSLRAALSAEFAEIVGSRAIT
jgi:hypothetical protein